MKACAGLLACFFLLTGCQAFLEGYRGGYQGYQRAEQEREQKRIRAYWSPIDAPLNNALGNQKDEIMRKIGVPSNCAPFRTGGEVCDWVRTGVVGGGGSTHPLPESGGLAYGYSQAPIQSWEERVNFTFDTQGVAREWVYSGPKGHRTSREAAN